MKTQTLAIASAIITCVTIPASAVNVSPQGFGQALIYPYYTVNNNQDTYVSISNGNALPAVIKVRFLEGMKGRPVLDVDVVLQPRDSWVAAITRTSDGGAKLLTNDGSCTRPVIPSTGLAFTASGYDGSNPDIPADSGPHDISRTSEGFAEVISGGWILPDAPAFAVDCSTIFQSLQPTGLDARRDISGWAAVIDVSEGHYYPYNAVALANFTQRPLYNDHWGPLEPSLADANSTDDTAVAWFFGTSASIPNDGGPQSATYTHGIDAVSAVLMADTIQNDYLIDPGLGASTDWVLTLPTRRFYDDSVYPAYRESPENGYPFTGYAAAIYDREGASALPDGENDRVGMDYNTNIVSFVRDATEGAPSGVFGSHLNRNFSLTADAGYMRLDSTKHRTTAAGSDFICLRNGSGDNAGRCIYGSPIVGFSAYNIVNAQAQPGRLGNYGALLPHHTTVCYDVISFNNFICGWY